MEVWKKLNTVPSFELYENYKVSNTGKIYSLYQNKILKTTLRLGNGLYYERVSLTDINKNRKTFSVHRIIAIAFKFNENHNLLTVNHIDENTLNNSAHNLEWMSLKENVRYSQHKKTYIGIPDDLIEEYNASTFTISEFAEKYNAPLSTMWDVINKMGSKSINNKSRKLIKEPLISEIYEYRKSGKTLKECAEKFNCSLSLVSLIYRTKVKNESYI